MTQQEVATVLRVIAGQNLPLLIIAAEVAPACVITLLGSHERDGPRVAAIHPPDYGHWRKAMLDDIAIMTGGRVSARDLGGRIEDVAPRDLDSARRVRISSNQTISSADAGDPMAIDSWQEQVRQKIELVPPNIERDNLQERLARLAGGAAMILAGGATPVEQKRHAQLIEDAINAARAAAQGGIVTGGGTALLQASFGLDKLIKFIS
jgi:chaperonin GroEL